MHPVVSHPQVGDAGVAFLLFLQLQEKVTGIVLQMAIFPEFLIEFVTQDAPVANDAGRVVLDRAFKQVQDIRHGLQCCPRVIQQLGRHIRQPLTDFRQHGQARAKAYEIPRPGGLHCYPGEDPLHVTGLPQQRDKLRVTPVIEQPADGVMTTVKRRPVPGRIADPPAQQASPHGGCAPIHQCDQRVPWCAVLSHLDFQVGPGHRVHPQGIFLLLEPDAGNVRCAVSVQVADVLDQGTGGASGERVAAAFKRVQVMGPELVRKYRLCTDRVEIPVRYGAGSADPESTFLVLPEQHLGGIDAHQFVVDSGHGIQFKALEVAAGHLQRGYSHPVFLDQQRRHQVLLPPRQEVLLGQGARGDYPDDLALHRALAGGGVANLFADRHGHVGVHQLPQILVHAVVRDTGHGNRLSGGFSPGREGDIQDACGLLRILVEQFVEIPHAVEQQHAGEVRLDGQVLAHHRCMRFGLVHGAGSNRDLTMVRSSLKRRGLAATTSPRSRKSWPPEKSATRPPASLTNRQPAAMSQALMPCSQ